jgi:HAD superfamily phosphatase (TIGR01668 family)
MLHLIQPHIRVKSVLELTPERLRAWGIGALLLDVDCTLKRYRQTSVDAEIIRWLAELQDNGIPCCIISNGLEPRIQAFAGQLGLPFVAKAMKPSTAGVKLAMQKLSVTPPLTAIVGDQLFADILAGRLAGIRTILVEPIHPEEEPWYTRLKRYPEAWALKWFGSRS